MERHIDSRALLIATVLFLINGFTRSWAQQQTGTTVETNLQFYMHDLVFVQNATAIPVAGASSGPQNASNLGFGTIFVIDDALTEGPLPTSKSVGRAQGTYMVSALDITSFLLTFTAVFNPEYGHNGTLSFHGADRIMQKQREISVVGGTGVFRYAQGYAVIETNQLQNYSAVLFFNVSVRQLGSDPSSRVSSSSLSSPTAAPASSSALAVHSSLSLLIFFTILLF